MGRQRDARLTHRVGLRAVWFRRHHQRAQLRAAYRLLHSDRLGSHGSVLGLVGKVGPTAPSLRQLALRTNDVAPYVRASRRVNLARAICMHFSP